MMTAATFLTLLSLVASASWAPPGEWGSWVKDFDSPPKGAFRMAKAGAFSRNGTPKWTLSKASLEQGCNSFSDPQLWITHRLSKGETLSADAGTRLGRAIKAQFGSSCVTAVELDIEPMDGAPPWLGAFVKAVKGELPPTWKLRLAVPALSSQPLKELHWKGEHARTALEAADGLDFMIYDTGTRTPDAYGRVLRDTLSFVASLPKDRYSFVLGFPAYPDRTQRHHLATENLEVVAKLIAALPPDLQQVLCRNEVRLAYYAGWTVTEKDFAAMKSISEEKVKRCF